MNKSDTDKSRDLPSFTCPRCTMTSYNPNDIKYGYCGNCHDYTWCPPRLPADDEGKP